MDSDDDESSADGLVCKEVSSTSKSQEGICHKDQAYLDTGATQHSCCNVDLLERHHISKVTLRQHCNAGVKLKNRMGWVGPFKFGRTLTELQIYFPLL
jgi:hypothetical protein